MHCVDYRIVVRERQYPLSVRVAVSAAAVAIATLVVASSCNNSCYYT